MAAAAAAALPAMLQAGAPTTASGGSEPRDPTKRYKKSELIGQGAQKKVYRAFDEERGIEVAWNEVAVAELARFHEKDQQRVFAEIRVLKQLKHKNIMTLHDYWFEERRFMLIFITEIFPDGTLRQYRRRHKHADVPAIKRWAWQILQGLVYLHGHNPPIIHRDLKCDNIFVSGSSGVVKIGDLGLVTLCSDFSAPQSVLGTPEFMAPELYEEKYDEKVDVYAFGMCLLELATMEYPYCECKNAAQIYKKVSQGIPPASVEKLVSAELRDFITLCLVHDPNNRPEARQLLKHSFFEAIRASASSNNMNGAASAGASPRLTVVSSTTIAVPAAAVAADSAGVTLADGMSPTMLSRASSVTTVPRSAAGSAGGAPSAVDLGSIATAAAAAMQLGSIAAAAGGVGGASAPLARLGNIASAAGPAAGSMLDSRSDSAELLPPPQQQPLGAIAAALAHQQSFGSQAAAGINIEADRRGACGMQPATLGAGDGFVPVMMAASPPMGSIIAAAVRGADAASAVQSSAGGGGMMASPLSVAGLGSIASSISPTPKLGLISVAAAGDGSAPVSPSRPTANGGNVSPSRHSGGGAGFGGSSHATSALTTALQLSPSGADAAGGGANTLQGALVGGTAATSPEPTSEQAQKRPQQASGPYPGISSSAAAIAAAAVSAAAAAVAASGSSFHSLGLPSIHEDHELNENVLFDNEENGGRHGTAGGGDDSDSEDGDASDSASERSAGNATAAGDRSQPVSLKVRSSGQAAAADMALSFAMSFTNQRGVRKKVGFQYDMLHDTASAIAVEMVENLSLNTAEAEAIAAMIQYEVSRRQQPQDQEQNQQQ